MDKINIIDNDYIGLNETVAEIEEKIEVKIEKLKSSGET